MLASRATLPQKQRQQRRWKHEEEMGRSGEKETPEKGRESERTPSGAGDGGSRMKNAITILKNGPGLPRENGEGRRGEGRGREEGEREGERILSMIGFSLKWRLGLLG